MVLFFNGVKPRGMEEVMVVWLPEAMVTDMEIMDGESGGGYFM